MRVHRVQVSGVGVHEPTRKALYKANNFIQRRFPTRTLRNHCSYNVAVLHCYIPKGVAQSGTEDRRYI